MAKSKRKPAVKDQTRPKNGRRPPPPKQKEVIKALGIPLKSAYLLPEMLQNIDYKQLKKAYSELRKVANLRLKRMEKKGMTDYSDYKYFKDQFIPLKEIKARAKEKQSNDFEAAIEEVETIEGLILESVRFLNTSGVQNIKTAEEKAVETFRAKGGDYAFITTSNIKEFGDYMESLREKYNLKRGSFDSERAVTMFKTLRLQGYQTGSIEDNFKSWLGHEKELKKLTIPKKSGKLRTSQEISQMLSRKLTKKTRKEKKRDQRKRQRSLKKKR